MNEISPLHIIPLGGLGEIGLNMMAFEYEETILVVDAGLMFPEDYMLGVDYVTPDMGYLKENLGKLAGIILTHAHEDHIGALPYFLRLASVPVYGTPFTLGMARHKLQEHGIAAEFISVNPGETISLGPFSVEFIRVEHSVLEGVGLAIQTPAGTIIHTGDFKISHGPAASDMMTDVARFAHYGEQGVLALLSDSTNVEKDGYTPSESQIGAAIETILRDKSGRIIVSLFASNVARVQQVVDLAARSGRKVVISGRSIEASTEIAKGLGLLVLPEGLQIRMEDIDQYPDGQLMLITTGAQGEPMSALARIAAGHHKHFKVKPDDTVVLSSKFIPGNEKAIAAVINNLYRLGADVIYEKISAIHGSGHAFRDELNLMIKLTHPAHFIPIHGEYRHLTLHARLARQAGIPEDRVLLAENGQTIVFDSQGGHLGDKVPTGRVFIDGKGIGDVGRSVLKERRNLSEDGFVVVNLAFDAETGTVLYGPELASRGFISEAATGYLLEEAKCIILEILEDIGPDTPNRVEDIRARVKTGLKQYFGYAIDRRPIILPFIVEI